MKWHFISVPYHLLSKFVRRILNKFIYLLFMVKMVKSSNSSSKSVTLFTGARTADIYLKKDDFNPIKDDFHPLM